MTKGKRLAGTIIIPVLVLIITNVICMSRGVTMFENSLNWLTFARAVANVSLVTFALSINLNSGRFDFSVGSIALLSSVFSATLAVNHELSPVWNAAGTGKRSCICDRKAASDDRFPGSSSVL